MKGRIGLLFLAAGVAGIDQLSKGLLVQYLRGLPRPHVSVGPFFDLVLMLNRGVSFSMLTQSTEGGRWMLVGLTVLLSLGIMVWLWIAQERYLKLGLALVLGGAVGNIIDRIRLGGVLDFFHFHIASFSWPAFNVADIAITCGVIVIIYEQFSRVGNKHDS